jgi:hypothetical protein
MKSTQEACGPLHLSAGLSFSAVCARLVALLAASGVLACGNDDSASESDDDEQVEVNDAPSDDIDDDRDDDTDRTNPEMPNDDPVSASGVTWHKDIAPLMQRSCVGCHQAGGIAPFALSDYEEGKALAPLIAEAVSERSMPPWAAVGTEECEPRFDWKDDIRLSEEEIALVETWVNSGSPEGEAQAVVAEQTTSLTLKNSDVRLTIPTPVTVSGNRDKFVCFSIDPKLEEDAWLVATQVNPGNQAIVHHVLTYLDTEGASAELAGGEGYYDCFGGPGVDDAALLGAWAPGAVPLRTPDKVALQLPAGSRLIVNVHYHPSGAGEEVDADTSIDLEFTDDAPEYIAALELIGNFSGAEAFGGLLPGDGDPATGPEFRIPAGAKNHVEEMTFIVPPQLPKLYVWAIGTHMHYVGRDMKIDIERAEPGDEPKEECLLHTPQWDFNWQRGYLYDAALQDLPTVGPNDTLKLRCIYDNSMDNPFVREALAEQDLDAPRDVVLGEESLDEMCLGVFGVAYRVPGL